jgi:hypothetical protein
VDPRAVQRQVPLQHAAGHGVDVVGHHLAVQRQAQARRAASGCSRAAPARVTAQAQDGSVQVRLPGHAVDPHGRNRLEPHRLPDPGGALVPDLVRALAPVLLAARLGEVVREVLRADGDDLLAVRLQGGRDVGRERRVAALVRRHQVAVHPDAGAVVDRPEVQQQALPGCRSASSVRKLRRYQTTEWKPVSPIPLAGLSGGKGTSMVRSKTSARVCQLWSRPTQPSS